MSEPRTQLQPNLTVDGITINVPSLGTQGVLRVNVSYSYLGQVMINSTPQLYSWHF